MIPDKALRRPMAVADARQLTSPSKGSMLRQRHLPEPVHLDSHRFA
jgi:hypothetical protein